MAEPVSRYTDPSLNDAQAIDPEIQARDPRYEAANDARVDNRAIIENQTGRTGSGVKIALAAMIAAAIAYFLFAPDTQPPTPPESPAATAPGTTPPASQDAAPSQRAVPAPVTQP